MKSRSFALASFILVSILGTPVLAGVVYDNGTTTGNAVAWGISGGFSVADSFTLASDSTVLAAIFTAWELPGDTVSGVSYEILNDSSGLPGSTVLASGSVTPYDTFLYQNDYSYDIDSIAFNFGSGVSLSAGTTYWFLLQDATATTNGDSVFWDENGNGPSVTWTSSNGLLSPPDCSGDDDPTTCSQTFSLLDNTVGPEPGSLALGGGGMLLLACGTLRRKRRS